MYNDRYSLQTYTPCDHTPVKGLVRTPHASEAIAVSIEVTQQRRGADLNDGEGRVYFVDCSNLCGTPTSRSLTR